MHWLVFTLIFQGLAAWALCCLAKALLDVSPGKLRALRNVLGHITFPILSVMRLITPEVIPKTLHIYLAAIWLLTARVAIFVAAGAYGLLPVATS